MQKRSLTSSELDAQVASQSSTEYLVRDFLPLNTVATLVGDSSLGKTPFCIHLAVCVAAGVPFLTNPTSQGDVLYIDHENSGRDFIRIRDTICSALGIPRPNNIHRLTEPTIEEVQDEIRNLKPALTIIDTLRLFDPKAESTLPDGAPYRMRWFKRMTAFTTLLFIHHPRKDPDDLKLKRPALINSRVCEWLKCSAGSFALVNQSDVRIGFDKSHEPDDKRTYDVIIRSQIKTGSEGPPWKLVRVLDEHTGEPLIYTKLEGRAQLTTAFQSYLRLLPQTPLTFSEVTALLNLNRRYVSDFLKAACQAGLMVKTGAHHETRYTRS